MGSIFNKKVYKKCNLWDHEQCTNALFTLTKSTIAAEQKKRKKKEKNAAPKRRRMNNFHPNGHIYYTTIKKIVLVFYDYLFSD